MAVVIGLLGLRRVVHEALVRCGHHPVADLGVGVRLEPIDPAITHAIAELLLLPPQDRIRQVAFERLAQHRFLDPARATGTLPDHLVLRIDAHRHVEEFAVQERHARLHAPGHHRFVGAQAVVVVQRIQLAHQLFVELAGVGRFVEVQVAAEDFVAALTGEHHLYAHRLDPSRQQEHRGGGADGGDVVGFHVADHVGQRIKPFFEGVLETVVDRAERFGGDGSGGQVGRALQANGERVQARPPGLALVAIFDAVAGIACSHGGYQRGIKTAGQQHAVGHVGHQLPVHGALERFTQCNAISVHAFHRVIVAPRALVVAGERVGGAVIPVAGRELRGVGAGIHQRFQFGGHQQAAVLVVAPVQRHHADRIARDQHALLGPIPQREREDAVEAVQVRGRGVLLVQRVDHLAVRAGLERIRLGQFGLEFAVVVDLAVDRQGQAAVVGQQRLRAAGRVDDGQPLVDQDGAVIDVYPAPVRAAMALALRQVQRVAAQRGEVIAGLQAEHSEDRTHGNSS